MARGVQRRPKGGKFLFCLLLLAAMALGYGKIYRVKSVQVEGLTLYDSEYVAALSGINLGESVFRVGEDAARRGISADPYLELTELSIRYPSTVVLAVRERRVLGAVSCSGVYLLIDGEGRILENVTHLPQGMPEVTGVKVSSANPGTKLAASQSDQVDILLAILGALEGQGATSLVSKIDVTDRNSLYLVTASGVRAMLGDELRLDNKVAWLRAALAELEKLGYAGGELDLSSGESAVYANSGA